MSLIMANEKDIKQIIAEEYKKCAVDPVHFMKKFCTIQHPQKGKMKFNLYPFQEKVLEQMLHKDYNIILKSRQLGISTLTAGYALWFMLFNSDKNIIAICTKLETAKSLVTKVKVMHDNLPSWLKMKKIEDNKTSQVFANGSRIHAIASSEDAGRSEAVSLLIIDEAAFVPLATEIWGAAQQTLATGGKAIVLSTPNGIGNWFHKQWIDAENGLNNFNTIFLHWAMHPERDQSWRDEQDKILGVRLAAQECDADFMTSGNTVVESAILEIYKKSYIIEPIEKRGAGHELWIWEYPQHDKAYVVTADVSRGDGSDFSAFHVIDIETVEQVAEYKGKMSTKDFGNFLVSIATEYNDALLIVENTGIGWAAIQQIIDRNYSNLFYTARDMRYVDLNLQYTNKYNRESKQLVPGFTTSVKSRPLAISKLELYMREKLVIIHSNRTLEELYTFIWNGPKAEALSGYNDDLVMSLAIGLWVRDTALKLNNNRIEMQKVLLGKINKTEDPIYTQNDFGYKEKYNQQMVIQTGNEKENLEWLY